MACSLMDWHPRYHRAALDGMRALSLEDRGAYNTVLDLLYDRGGPLPDDDRWLSGWMGCDVRKWKAIKKRLVDAGKLVLQAGIKGVEIVNARAMNELGQAEVRRRSHGDRGKIGGTKSGEVRRRGLKTHDKNEANAKQNEPQDIDSNSDKEEGGVGARAREDRDAIFFWKTRLFEVAGPGLGDPVKTISLNDHRASDLAAWRRAGVDLEADAVPVVAAMTAAPRDDPIRVWGYFTRPVLEAKARREAELKTPEVKNNGARTGAPYRTAAERNRALAEADLDGWRKLVEGSDGDAVDVATESGALAGDDSGGRIARDAVGDSRDAESSHRFPDRHLGAAAAVLLPPK